MNYISNVTYESNHQGHDIVVGVPYLSEKCRQHLVVVMIEDPINVAELFAWNTDKKKWEWYSTLPNIDSEFDRIEEGLLRAVVRHLNRHPIPGFAPQKERHENSTTSN